MSDEFDSACDRLSHAVDAVQYERLRWSRNEGPMLDGLVALLREALGPREEFELSEEGSAGARRRFVIKVHTFRIAAVNIELGSDGQVAMWGETIERGRGRVPAPQRFSAPYSAIDLGWMQDALARVFAGIEADGRVVQ